jgi:type II secretory pathway component HofQ
MKGMKIGLALALGLLGMGAVPAEEAPKPAAAVGGGGEGRNPLVSLQFEDRPFSEVMDYLARQAGVNIVPAPELAARKVTVLLIALDWKKALRVVANQVGGYVEESGPNLYRITNPPRVTYTTLTEGNEIKEVLTVIAEFAGANIVVADSVKGKVNLRLKDVPWKHAVEQAVKAAGDYAIVEEEFNLLRVVPTESLKSQITKTDVRIGGRS